MGQRCVSQNSRIVLTQTDVSSILVPVFIAGGVDWLKLGRKELKATSGAEDLQAPHALRALSNVKVTKIFSGPGANHAVAIDSKYL
jgi:hypothetical protein